MPHRKRSPRVTARWRTRDEDTPKDKNPNDPEADEKFNALINAYEVIRSPETRAQYDRHGTELGQMGKQMDNKANEAVFVQLFGGQAFDSSFDSVTIALETFAFGDDACMSREAFSKLQQASKCATNAEAPRSDYGLLAQ